MKKIVLIAFVIVISIPQIGSANIFRSKSLAGSTTVLNDTTSDVTLLKFNNPLGLLQFKKKNSWSINGLITNDRHDQTNYAQGRRYSKETYIWSNNILFPEEEQRNAVVYWIDDKNVVSVDLGFNNFKQGRSSDNPTVDKQSPDSDGSLYSFNATYAVHPVERLMMGLKLGYNSGNLNINEYTRIHSESHQSIVGNNSMQLSLVDYNLGAALNTPLGETGEMLLGVSFRPYDKKPFNTESSLLQEKNQPSLNVFTDITGLNFDFDLAGGYTLNQTYTLWDQLIIDGNGSAANVTTTTKADVSNEITPQGNIISIQNQWNLFKKHKVGLSVDFSFADHQTKKEVRQTDSTYSLYTVEEGKSSEMNGMDFTLFHTSTIELGRSELRIGSKASLGRSQTLLYDFQSESNDQIGDYQIFPVNLALGAGFLPIKSLLFLGEVEWNNMHMLINKLDLSPYSGFPTNFNATAIQNSSKEMQELGVKVGTEYYVNDAFSLRVGYNYSISSTTYLLKDENNSLIEAYKDKSKAGTAENPYLIDNEISFGIGVIQSTFQLDIFAALHFLNYTPQQKSLDYVNFDETKHERFASEIGASIKAFF